MDEREYLEFFLFPKVSRFLQVYPHLTINFSIFCFNAIYSFANRSNLRSLHISHSVVTRRTKFNFPEKNMADVTIELFTQSMCIKMRKGRKSCESRPVGCSLTHLQWMSISCCTGVALSIANIIFRGAGKHVSYRIRWRKFHGFASFALTYVRTKFVKLLTL